MKKVAVINDISGFGKCSLTAAIPVLSVQGVQACPVPTAVLSNQTGYPEYFCVDFTDKLRDYLAVWNKTGAEFDAVLSGFLAGEEQVDIVSEFCLSQKRKGALVVVDPVMADDGEVYGIYSLAMCQKIKELAFSADIITPNITEFSVLTDCDYKNFEALFYKEEIIDFIKEKCSLIFSHGVSTVVVTSVRFQEGKLSNVIITKDGDVQAVSSEDYGGSYSGTGDLFVSAVCGSLVKGDSVYNSVCRASRFLEASVYATKLEGTENREGICFEPFLKIL